MKAICPPSYNRSGFVVTHALGHMMYACTLFVPMNQRVLKKLSKEHNISNHKWVKHSLVYWYQQCVTVYHVAKCMSCHKTTVVITGRTHCFHDYIYITIILLLWDLSNLCVVDQLWPLIYMYISGHNWSESEIFFKIYVFLKLFLLYTTHH